jgi:hypothetical protein
MKRWKHKDTQVHNMFRLVERINTLSQYLESLTQELLDLGVLPDIGGRPQKREDLKPEPEPEEKPQRKKPGPKPKTPTVEE